MTKNEYQTLIRTGIYGLAVADAVGVPVEFESRSSLRSHPVTDMMGYGTYHQPAGTWSDDTSMTLCLADSMAETGRIDLGDIMTRFAHWLFEDAYTPWNKCFDAGHTCIQAVSRFQHGTEAALCGGTAGNSNGNGSLMRILPLLFPLLRKVEGDIWENDNAMTLIGTVSGLTHRHAISRSACGIYLAVAQQLVKGLPVMDAVKTGVSASLDWYKGQKDYTHALHVWKRIADAEKLRLLPEDAVNSTGYVVDTLEAALWCLLTTDNYRDCVLKAVNLGSDTDTTAAVAGGLAALVYGMEGIPAEWVAQLARRDFIDEICEKLAEREVEFDF